MRAAIAVVYLLVAVMVIIAIVSRFRFNSRTGRVRANAVAPQASTDPGVRHKGPGVSQVAPPTFAGAVRYSEDGIYRTGRVAAISAGIFVLATLGFAALLVTNKSQTTWLPIVVMLASGIFVVGTLISSKPGIRVSDECIAVGHVAYAERHPSPGFSEKMGVPHFVASLFFDYIVEVRFLSGKEAIASVRDTIRTSAPPRVTANNKPSKARKRVFGLFYNGGFPDAMYIRIQPDHTVPVPLVVTASGMGSTTTLHTTWSGPEFLIGTKRPLELQKAVRDAVSAYELVGGNSVRVELPDPEQSST